MLISIPPFEIDRSCVADLTIALLSNLLRSTGSAGGRRLKVEVLTLGCARRPPVDMHHFQTLEDDVEERRCWIRGVVDTNFRPRSAGPRLLDITTINYFAMFSFS